MINGGFAEYIGLYSLKQPINIAAANDLTVQYGDVSLPTEVFKITNSAEVNVGCIVPFVGHHIGYRHTSEEE